MTENYRIIFTGPGVAELQAAPLPRPQDHELLIRTRVSLISPGTERAFFLGLPNTSRQYPQASGYSNIGEVVAVGAQVQGWSPGDRVAGEDLAPRLAELCGGEGAAVVVEATGHPEAILTALTLARPFGRVVLLGSTRGETDHVNFYRDVHKKGLTLIGAHDSARPRLESTHGWWTQHDDRGVALKLLARRRLQVEPLITDRFAWQDALAAYETLKSWSHTALGLILDWTR